MTKQRILIQGGHVVTVDPELGTIAGGEVLIEDGVIAAVGRDLGVTDAEIVDARGKIVSPGTVDTHRHTWQCQLRGACSDMSLQEYIFGFRPDVTASYEAEDVRIGNLVGALEALNAGVTTLLDFSHVTNTPAHAEAGISALREAGIRAVYAYGLSQANLWAPPDYDRMKDLARFAREGLTSDLVTLGAALSEPGLAPMSVIMAQKQLADELGAVSTTHIGALWSLPTGIAELAAAGVLDSRFLFAHANALSDADWQLAADAGVKVSTSPDSELNMGMGRVAIGKAMSLGLRPTLSVDVVSLSRGDIFGQARQALTFTRWANAEPVIQTGQDVQSVPPSAAEALRWATINGADALGLGDRVGSLSVGKQADVLIVGGSGLVDATPVNHPEGQLVFQCTPGQVESVLVAGVFVKRDGKLLGVDLHKLLAELEESAERVKSRMAAIAAVKEPPSPEMLAQFPAWFAGNLAS